MCALPDGVMQYLEKQGFVIVSTIDAQGHIHCSAKGIVGLEQHGTVYVMDVYMQKTFQNLQRDPRISITAVDEHTFTGFTLQGNAHIVPREQIKDHLMQKWEKRIIDRMTKRVIKSVQAESQSKGHFEARLPHVPQYLIEIDVEQIINLSPVS